jgi:hypothetical protein
MDLGDSLPPLRWEFHETFRLGLEHDSGCAHDTRAPGFWPLVDPSLFVPCFDDGGSCFENPLLGQPSNRTSALGPWGLAAVRVLVITPPFGEILMDGRASD